VDGVVGECVWLVGVDNPKGCMVWCVGVVCWCGVLRWCVEVVRDRNMHANTVRFRLLTLVLLIANHMLPIENLMVDGGCIATTGGSRLFCISI
jgi:hypothetical protein